MALCSHLYNIFYPYYLPLKMKYNLLPAKINHETFLIEINTETIQEFGLT